RLGSTSTMRTSSGVARIMIEVIIELTKLDLPAPVAPATSRCGIFARLAMTYPPSTSLPTPMTIGRSEEHTSELQSRENLVCRLLLEKKKKQDTHHRLHTNNNI